MGYRSSARTRTAWCSTTSSADLYVARLRCGLGHRCGRAPWAPLSLTGWIALAEPAQPEPEEDVGESIAAALGRLDEVELLERTARRLHGRSGAEFVPPPVRLCSTGPVATRAGSSSDPVDQPFRNKFARSVTSGSS
jgi:hypothetical protein